MTAQDCIAMGDSMNDYDMLKYAGISIAMEDSPEKLIAISDAVAKTADEGGVADALREFVLDK
jgi:hydroxymethylpyrimidine pyrophosphatase-like HAD family hydrolase